jgi:Reverse transcriptase (RNA-dependent DNA polymerase)
VLHKLVDICYVVYLDNILIFSKTEEEYAEYIEVVLYKLRIGALYASPKKCAFFVKEVEYLGFLIGENGVQMDLQRVAAIADWLAPRNFKEVQIFLGFMNFYRRFIAGFSHITRPLSGLLKGSKDGKTFGT